MASGIYNRFKANLFKRLHDLVNDTVKVALYGPSFAFTASDTAYSTTNEIGGTGYSAGGATLSNKGVTEAGTAVWDADDPSWAGASFSAYFALFYDQTPCNTLICAVDFGGVQTITGGTFTLQIASSGILRLT